MVTTVTGFTGNAAFANGTYDKVANDSGGIKTLTYKHSTRPDDAWFVLQHSPSENYYLFVRYDRGFGVPAPGTGYRWDLTPSPTTAECPMGDYVADGAPTVDPDNDIGIVVAEVTP